MKMSKLLDNYFQNYREIPIIVLDKIVCIYVVFINHFVISNTYYINSIKYKQKYRVRHSQMHNLLEIIGNSNSRSIELHKEISKNI